MFFAPLQLAAPPSGQTASCPLPRDRAENDTAAESRLAVCNLVLAGKLADLTWPDFSHFRDILGRLYAPNYELLWTSKGRPTSQSRALVEAFTQAGRKGLQPDEYDGPLWQSRMQRFTAGPPAPAALASFDLTLTVSAIRYVSDIHVGRVNPRDLECGLVPNHFDVAEFIRSQLVSSANPKDALEKIEPDFDGYRRTLKALEDYRKLAAQPEPAPLPEVKKPVLPGQPYSAALQLAQKLQLLGDLQPDAQLSAEPGVYGEPLSAAVRRFQSLHGLTVDGRLGPETIRELNVPAASRVVQLTLAVERWRWLPADLKPPLVVVNIPEFQLRAYQTRRLALSMKVIVGKAFDHQTPIFIDNMRYIIFKPYWNVPRSIIQNEILPALAAKPNYFARHRMEITDGNGRIISQGRADAATLQQLRAGRLQLRQRPGQGNSLGQVKFVLPNQHDVYLHGTPERGLFLQFRRDFSHGCIRVEDPESLAAWLLREDSSWTPARIRASMNGARTFQVLLPRPVPVLILYGTAFVEENGEVRFYQDIYRQDAALERALAARRP